jgi:hypothetical protein
LVRTMVDAIWRKGVVQSRMAGIPARSSSTLSWQLHDVQEPQSPLPAKTRWAAPESLRIRSGGAPSAADRLRSITTPAAP